MRNKPDPKASDYTWLNPFTYCAGDPINLVDPTGCSTMVTLEPDGRYKVVGGDLNDGDLRIYLVCIQEDGSRVKVGTVGVTPVITSFYDSDKGEWAKDSYIDPNDMSGKKFLYAMTGDNTPVLVNYALNAGNGGNYDFKTTNGTSEVISTDEKYTYRGMPIGKTEEGKTIYTSARDIGNMVAGYVAGANGLTWNEMRIGFDAYQSLKSRKFTTEGVSSQNAQKFGYNISIQDTSIATRLFRRLTNANLFVTTTRHIYRLTK